MSLRHIMPNELKSYFNKTNNPETFDRVSGLFLCMTYTSK